MYKIYIKSKNATTELYRPYTFETVEVDEEGVENKTSGVYKTDSLEELGKKYQELLATYTTEQIKLVQELDVGFIVTVTDN